MKNTTLRIAPTDYAPPAMVTRLRASSLVMGGLFSVVAIIVAARDVQLFLQSWLVGYMFWLGITLGCLTLLMLQYTTGGNWGILGRRFWEAATKTLPFMFLMWLPIAFAVGFRVKEFYPWLHMSATDLIPDREKYWLNPGWFIGRGIIYFVFWGIWAWRLNRFSRIEERGEVTAARSVSIQNFSGAGIVMYGLTITFASVDWVMSLYPMWWSTVWGMLFMVGECLTAFAFTIWLLARFAQTEPLAGVVKPDHFHDYGKLMFTFVVLWGYLSFSQWLIIWQGNITAEIRWYLDRVHGHWKVIATALIFLHFVLPFTIMLSRRLKRQPKKLVTMAFWIMAVRALDLFWLVQPSFHRETEVHGEILAPIGWPIVAMNIVNLLAIGGLWLFIFFWYLEKRSLMPVNDPQFAGMLESKHG